MKLRTQYRKAATLVMLLVSSMFVGVPSVSAAGYSGLLAGRPISGSGGCQGLAYGHVHGELVLFSAHHCRSSLPDYAPVYGPNGSQIGVWLPDYGTASAHDFAAIRLDGTRPTPGLNRIYRGNCGSGCLTYWTITAKYPSATLSCPNIDTRFGFSVYHNFQSTNTSTTSYRAGVINGYYAAPSGGSCEVQTSLPKHQTCCDSGSSFILAGYTNQVFAVGTRAPNTNIVVTPVYEGIMAMNNYLVSHGQSGAWFCTTGAC